MTIKVYQIGSDVIRQTAGPLRLPLRQSDLKTLDALTQGMRDANLVGMAAPQIGKSVRMFVMEIRSKTPRADATHALKVFINPEVTWCSEETEIAYEGCGSVADANLFGEVERHREVEVRYFDEVGKAHSERFVGFLARIVQHENDHLNGVVFTDKLHSTKTLLSGSEYRKMIKNRNAKNSSDAKKK